MGEIAPLWIDAYDAKGNLFTSVNTLPFEWDIPNILQALDFESARLWAESNGQAPGKKFLNPCGEVQMIAHFHMSDWMPVQGTKTGVQQVTARCKDPEHTQNPD